MISDTIQHSMHRKGMALPLVLFCIVLAMMLGAALTQAVLLQHRHAQLNDRQHQAIWLAESGVQRALSTLRSSPEYEGEVWEIPAIALNGEDAGRVNIQVDPVDGDAEGWTVTVTAIYPDDPRHRVLEQRELFVPVSEKGRGGE